jgi:succinoglycan biosynthesis protein ExoA
MQDIKSHDSLTPSVTVAIPAFNEEASISGVLELFLNSQYPNIVEIVIADGGSTDKTREIISSYTKLDHRVKLIHNPDKIQSAGINRIISIANGELFLRADAHSIYASDYVEKSVQALLESGALNAGGAQRFIAKNPFQAGIALASRSFLGSGGAKYRNPYLSGFADTVYIGCYYTKILRELGGFSTTNGPNEDAEMNIRLSKMKDNAIYVSSEIKSWYLPRQNLLALIKQYFRYGRGRFITNSKHPDLSPVRSKIPVLVLSFVILFLVLATLFGMEFRFLILIILLLVILPVVSAFFIVIRENTYFHETVWKGDPEQSPGIISRWLTTAPVLLTMPIAFALGFIFQMFKYLVTKKKEW